MEEVVAGALPARVCAERPSPGFLAELAFAAPGPRSCGWMSLPQRLEAGPPSEEDLRG